MKRKVFKITAIIAVITLISGAAILATASAGTSADPLITLSYLNGPYRTLIGNDINAALSRLTTRISTAESRINNELSRARTDTANTFKYTTIANGTSLTLPAGSEVMLREGTVTLSSGTLIRYTGTPGTISSGSLAINNMYIADGQIRLTASGGAAKVWVRTDSGIAIASVDEDEIIFDLPGDTTNEPPETVTDVPSEPTQPDLPSEPAEPEVPTDLSEPDNTSAAG